MTAHAYLADALLCPSPTNPNETAFNRAYNTPLGVFDWYELPENKIQLLRCIKAMDAGKMIAPLDAVLQGYDWSTLEEGAVVVDVGGGIGVSSIAIAQACPELYCIVQDRPQVEADGKRVSSS